MTSGLPDFTRDVRPRHGGAEIDSNQKTAVANSTTFLTNVTGKGIIYGGALLITHTSTQANSLAKIFIDDVEMVSVTFFALNFYSLNKDNSALFYALKYDDVSFIYSVGLMPGITFEKEVTIAYEEKHGTTPIITSWMIYALM